MLIKNGAKIDEPGYLGNTQHPLNTPLEALIKGRESDRNNEYKNKYEEIVKILLKNSAGVNAIDNNSVLIDAIQSNDLKIVENLISSISLEKINSDDNKYNTYPLIQSCNLKRIKKYENRINRIEIIKLLIKSGADVNILAKRKRDLNEIIIINPIIEVLISSKLENMTQKIKDTVVCDILKILLQSGTKLIENETPSLFYANIDDTIEALIKAGANVNARDKNNYTPLFHQLDHFSDPNHWTHPLKKMQLLISAGADLNINCNDYTPLKSILRIKNKYVNEYAQELIKYKPSVELIGTHSPLMTAIENYYCNIDTIMALIKIGANVNDKNSQGATALDFARQRNDPRITTALIKAGAK